MLRSTLISFASLTATSPIEAITLTFIIVTLVYFQLLHAIKGSEFFLVPAPSPPPKPIHLVRLAHPAQLDESTPYLLPSPHSAPFVNSFSNSNLWSPLPSQEFKRILEANAFEDGYVFPESEGGNHQGENVKVVLIKQLTVVKEDGEGLDEWENWVLNDVGVDVDGQKYTYKDFGSEVATSLIPHPIHPSQFTLTLYLQPPTPEIPTLSYLHQLGSLPAFVSAASNTTFKVLPTSTGTWGLMPSFEGAGLFAGIGDPTSERDQIELLAGMRNVRWLAYAVRALGMRFWALAKNADSADIFVVLLGYILMHATFVSLFINMRKMGSSFWLPFATIVSSTFAFLVALLAAYLLNVPVDPICLSEALPFLVITVGFDKPYMLAQAIFKNPEIAPVASSPEASPSKDDAPLSKEEPAGLGLDLGALHKGLAPLERLQKLAEGKGVRWAAPVAAKQIVIDGVRKVGVGIVKGYAMEVAVLCVGALSGIGGLREFCYLAALIMTADCVFLFSFYVAILAVMVEVHRIKLIRGNRRARSTQRSSSSTSVNPSSSPSPTKFTTWSRKNSVTGIVQPAADIKKAHAPASPVFRLKLLLIISFLTLHILNLCTTLTEQTALKRHSTHSTPKVVPRSDPRSPSLSPILEALYASQPGETDMVVQIIPATNIVMSFDGHTTSRMASIDHFMSEWSTLVGDPVLSKWIVVCLGISVLLNGYLLKGIASNSIGGKGPVAAAALALASVFDQTDQPKRRRWSAGGSSMEEYRQDTVRDTKSVITPKGRHSKLPPTFTHPAPNTEGDSTPRGEGRVNGDAMGHIVIAPTPKVPIITETAPLPRTASSSSISSLGMSFGRRSLEECVEVFAGGVGSNNLSDEEVIFLVEQGKIAGYALEKTLKNLERAVRIRRAVMSRQSLTQTLEASALPMADYDYKAIIGACCENVIGYMPIPVGIAGPLNVDGQLLHIPMATTEGTLVASTSRGSKALNEGGGVITVLTADAMTRGPAIDFPSITMAADCRIWIDSASGFAEIKAAFESTSRFAKLQSLKCALAGRTLYVRFATQTGDAMGMNMISKGVEKALEMMEKRYPEMDVLALSGNYCIDKKAAAINWIEGRGKSVVAEAIVKGDTVKKVLKTTVKELCNLNIKKNLIGSAMAGAVGGFNAHASNILTAIYLATGQDPAQNVESSNCMTLMEPINDGQDLLITVSMPSVEVGTVGGGTILAPQRAMLELLGVAGAHPTTPGANAQRLARIIAAAVMAGELSLMSALAAGHLIQAHMKHNRSVPATPGAVTPFGAGMTPLKANATLSPRM